MAKRHEGTAYRSGAEVADFTSVLRDVHIPCWVVDDQGMFVWVNEAFRSVFGDRQGEHYSTLVAPESLEAAVRHFECAELAGQDEDELGLLLADGSRVRTEISSVLIEGVGYVCAAFGLAGKPVRSRQAHAADLTPRQLEVLLLLAGGASTDQIARELYLSAVTVRNHISHILGQLGVHSRLAAVAKARRLGLVED